MSEIANTEIAIGLKTQGSPQVVNDFRNMSNSAKNLSNDIKNCTKETEAFALSAQKSLTKLELDKAKKQWNDLGKEIKNATDISADRMKDLQIQYQEAGQKVDELKAKYNSLGKATRDAFKEQEQATGGGGDSGLLGGLGAGLIKMRMFSQLGQAAQQYVFALGKSFMGERSGSALSNIAGGALSGFTLGAYTGNPLVMATGAGVGAATGAIQTATERMEKKDDAFRAEVENLYNTVQSEREASLRAGIEYAATEESNLKSMGILLGSQERGNELYQELKSYGINTMYQTPNMLTSAKRMLAYGVNVGEDIENSDLMKAIRWIGDVAMGEQSKFDSLAYVYGQTASAGKLTGQDLRQYTEAGFNPLAWLAEERGVSLEDMRKEMSEGKVLYQDVQHAFELATAEGAKFGGSASAMMDTYAGKMSKLADIQADIEGGYGRGYNEEREKGLDWEIEQLEGRAGRNMEIANELIGNYEADLENQHQQLIISAQQEVLNSEGFKELAKTNAPEAGRMLAEAKAKAEIEWQNSEGMQLKRQSELALVEAIGHDAAINGAYINFGIAMADAFTVGWQGRLREAWDTGGMMTYEEYGRASLQSGGFVGLWNNVSANLSSLIYGTRSAEKNERDRNMRNSWWRSETGKSGFNIGGALSDFKVRASEVVAENMNTNQTNNISVSVTVNEATDGAKIANMISSQIGNSIVRTAGKAVSGGKFKLARGH